MSKISWHYNFVYFASLETFSSCYAKVVSRSRDVVYGNELSVCKQRMVFLRVIKS